MWLAAYNGRPLTWISQGAPHAPDFGASWLRQFNGGMLVTCGLRHVGPPEQDERTGETRDLHGDYTRLRANKLSYKAAGRDDSYVLELTGAVAESLFFGEQLRLTRTMRMVLGEPSLEIRDVVENLFDTPAPFMLLHHFNFGYPLVQEGVRLHVASKQVLPRDMTARAAFGTWESYSGATPHHQEEVHFHHVFAGPDRPCVSSPGRRRFRSADRMGHDARAISHAVEELPPRDLSLRRRAGQLCARRAKSGPQLRPPHPA